METERQDIVWMDWAKAIGISLVVVCHIYQITDNGYHPVLQEIWNVIYLFHMPLFFMLSGYMYKESRNFKKILLTLIVPYLVYQLLFLPYALHGNIGQNGFSFILLGKHFLGAILGDGYNTPISFYDCLPCWFIVSIIQIRVLFHYIKINKKTTAILLLLCPTLLQILHLLKIDLYFCLDSTIMAIPYFLVGYGLAKYDILSRIKTSGGGIFMLCNA